MALAHHDHHEDNDLNDTAYTIEDGEGAAKLNVHTDIFTAPNSARQGSTPRYGTMSASAMRGSSRNHSDLGPGPEEDQKQPIGHNDQFLAQNHGDFTSRQLKAEISHTYAIGSGLLTGFCVATTFINHASIEHERKVDPLRYHVLIVHQIIVRACTAMALFSTLIFMLSTMYMKTALARPTYAFVIFDRFSQETATARKIAFWCMYYACIMYMLSISLVLFYTAPTALALVVATVVLAFLVVMWWYAHQMVSSAAVIFMPDDKLDEQLLWCDEEIRFNPCASPAPSAHQP